MLDVKCLALLIQSTQNQAPFVVISLLLLDGKQRKLFVLRIEFDEYFSNIVHGSDSEKAAKREIDLWFRAEELANWPHTAERWIYEWIQWQPSGTDNNLELSHSIFFFSQFCFYRFHHFLVLFMFSPSVFWEVKKNKKEREIDNVFSLFSKENHSSLTI